MSPRSVSSAPITLVRLDLASSIPLHRQIYNDLRSAIVTGRLARSAQLPSARTLARDLVVARQTVSLALDQLRAEGYVETRERSGTFVSHALPEELLAVERGGSRLPHVSIDRITYPPETRTPPNRPGRRSASPQSSRWYEGGYLRPFRPGPALEAFPWKVWGRLVGRHLRHIGSHLPDYRDPLGYQPLRVAIATYVSAARGVVCTADQVVITNGAQQALDLAARLLIKPGADVWIEEPCYRGARDACVAAGARLVPVPVDDHGLNVLEGIHRSPHAAMAYVTPSHQYPLGVTMTAARRLELLQWARASKAWIVEDDYNSEFRYTGRPLASLQGLDDSGRVIYVGTFSETLFPSLRIGYLVVPTSLVDAFAAARTDVVRMGPSHEAALTDFIVSGHFVRHVRRMRLLYEERRDALVQAAQDTALSGIVLGPSDAGMHVIGWLPHHISDEEVATHASQVGLDVVPLSYYASGRLPQGGLVLGFTAFPCRALKKAMTTLAAVVENFPRM